MSERRFETDVVESLTGTGGYTSGATQHYDPGTRRRRTEHGAARGGRGGSHAPEQESLADIIAAINERFGTDLDDRDRLEVEKVELDPASPA